MSRKFALIIGNSEYEDASLSQLVTPDADVDALARVLQDPEIGGFDEVTPLVNEPSATIRLAIARFFAKMKRDDLLLLYFSGHGVRDDHGNLYLAVNDTEHDLLSGTAVPAAFITHEMDRSRSRRQVLILDCCHSGAFGQGAKAVTGASVGTATAFEGTGSGRVVLTATDATQYAWEGDDVIGEAENSVFTHYLIQGLQTGEADADANGRITLDELYEYVYDHVVNETPKQTPGKWAYKQHGKLVIARNPNPVVKPAELPVELHQVIESPFAGAREGAVIELDRLLRGSDKSIALAAQQALERLVDDDSRKVSEKARRAMGIAPVGTLAEPATPSPKPTVKLSPPEPELHPSLALKMSAKPKDVDPGSEVTWTVTLRNDGDDTLHRVLARHGRTLLDEPFDLAVGKQRRFTFATSYKSEGKQTKNVTAAGTASNGKSVHTEASASVQISSPRRASVKTKPVPKTNLKSSPDVLAITDPIEEKKPVVPPQQPETSLAPSQGQLQWPTELLSKNWYSRKIRVFLTNDVHVINVKSPLGKPNTVEVDGEVVAENDEAAFFGWEGKLNFHVTDGTERRAATVEVGHHWLTDKITKCRLTIDNHILYSETES